MASIGVEVFDAKNIKDSLVFIENVSRESNVRSIKEQIARKLSLSLNRIALRLDAKGKNLKDEQLVGDLNLPSKNAQLYLRDLGPQISWQTVFILEYLGPLLIYSIFYLRPFLLYGSAARRGTVSNIAVNCAFFCWTIHYAKRLVETIFVHRFSNETMPLSNIFKNCIYYWGFAAFVSFFVNHPLCIFPSFGKCQILIGIFGFAICELGNFSIHLLLRDLRPPGTKIRKIPVPNSNPLTALYNFVSCPNYTYEVCSWIFFSMIAQSLPALLFALTGFLQMAVWAKAKHRNYLREFPNYPQGRRTIIPFIL